MKVHDICSFSLWIHGNHNNFFILYTEVLLENTCSANRPDNQCQDGNAECKDVTGLKCLCKDTFFKDKDGNCTKSKICIFIQPSKF